ncbi:MAG: Bax inhibitor-1/YccA family protein [Rhodoferax sp.]|jgi:modulator of FtsH protease
MTDQINTLNPGQGYAGSELQQRNKVLRNTYMLLSMSLIPTVLGAWLGVELGLAALFRGWLGMVLFMGVAFGFIYGIKKTQNSAAGVPMLLGFTFFMGLMLSPMIQVTLGFKNGPQLIMTAFAGTAGVFMGMAALSTVIKRDLSGMGKFLFVGLIMLVVGSLINVFVGSTAGMIVLSMVSIGIFSAYMLYDIKQIIDGGETNYISATLSLYLDLINVFQSLLALLGVFGGERD